MYCTLEYFFPSFPRKVFRYVLQSKLALSGGGSVSYQSFL